MASNYRFYWWSGKRTQVKLDHLKSVNAIKFQPFSLCDMAKICLIIENFKYKLFIVMFMHVLVHRNPC